MSLRSNLRSLAIVLAIVGVGTTAALVFDRVAYAAGQDDAAGSDSRFSSVIASPTTQLVNVPDDPSKPIVVNAPAGREVVYNGHKLSMDDPNGAMDEIWDYARSGRGRLTIGPIIVLLCWVLRNKLLGRFAWFKTTLGGWTLGFGTTALFYGGTAFAAGKPFTFNLMADAAVTAFAASGKWEALRDAINGMKAKIPPAAGVGAIVAIFAGVIVAGGVGGCAAWKASGAEQAIVECAKQDQTALQDVEQQLRDLANGDAPKWSDVYAQAKAHGAAIGGCALAVVVNEFLSRRLATPTSETWDAHGVLEEFRRKEAHGATFRTADGDL